MDKALIQEIESFCEGLKRKGYGVLPYLVEFHNRLIISVNLKSAAELQQLSKAWNGFRRVEGG